VLRTGELITLENVFIARKVIKYLQVNDDVIVR
jgi:hypothetical protein